MQAQWEALLGLTTNLQNRGEWQPRVVIGEIVEQLELLFFQMPFDQLYSHQETGNLLTFKRDRKLCKDGATKWGLTGSKEPKLSNKRRQCSSKKTKAQNCGFQKGRAPLEIPELRKLQPLPVEIIEKGPDWEKLTSIFPKFRGFSYNSNLSKIDESSALETLDSFLNDRGIEYSGGISSPNAAFKNGSRLSSHLAWGTMSLCSVFNQLDKRREELLDSEDRGKWNRSLRAF